MTRARFVTLEGIDGAGKSTHLDWLRGRLADRGIDAVVTREPGGTPLGESLRTLLLDRKQRLDPETETLLMFAARREHIVSVIEPALRAGRWILSDRFTDASYAYQSAGSGVPWEKVAALERWVQGDLQPDLTLYFDVAPEVGRGRAGAIRTADRFEQEALDFHARVREGYLRRARECPSRIRVVDAGRPIDDVRHELASVIDEFADA